MIKDMKTIKELYELSETHEYYCSDSSYNSLGFDTNHPDWESFKNEMGDSDSDMNLVFRWDIGKQNNDTYYMEIFIVHQRKGRFVPFMIDKVEDKDVYSILAYLESKKQKIDNLWGGI